MPSPGDHLRSLIERRERNLAPLDGLRAISILWVLSFHSAWYSIRYVSSQAYVDMLRARWLLPVWRGDFGVDLFFVLSGFLIAGLLLDEHERTGTIATSRFYLRRMLRLWPALAVALLVDQVFLRDYPGSCWAVLAYVSNFVSVWHVCMAWTWSLAIEAQFYAVMPWLLRVVGRSVRVQLMTVGLLLVVSCVLAVVICARGNFHAPDVEIVITRRPSQWVRAFDALYAKPWMRGGPLLAGVLAAILFRAPGFMTALARGRIASTLGLVAALLVAAVATHWPFADGAGRTLELLYLGCFRTAFGLAIAFVLLLALSEHPVGRVVGRWLSARALLPIARLAYGAYLLNPLVVMALHPTLARWSEAAGWSPISLFWPIDTICTLAAAVPLYVLVERPFILLRPHADA